LAYIGVVTSGKLPVGTLEGVRVGALFDAHNLIEIDSSLQ